MKRWFFALAVLASAAGLSIGVLCLLQSASAAVFSTHASGFDTPIIADSRGRVLHQGDARPRRLAADRWLAVDFDAQRSSWFDEQGRVLREGPYVEIRSDGFARHPDDPDQQPLFNAWSRQGMALLRADGSAFIDWQPGSGEWSATGHPQRYSWRPSEGGERIFDAQGTLRLSLDDEQMRAAGPFASRALYLVCDYSERPCELRDEAGKVLWRAQLDDLLEMRGGQWLGRSGNAWFRLDEDGRRLDDRLYAGGQYLPGRRTPTSDTLARWPRWMTQYHMNADASLVLEESAVSGFLQEDGQFDPVPRATRAYEVCPGTWRVNGPERAPRYWLVDGRGRQIAEHIDRGWHALEKDATRYMAYTEDERDALVDCRGTRLFDDPQVVDLEPMGPGFAGQLAGEPQRRLWLDAELRRQLLPEGSAIQSAGPDGKLLVIAQDGALRLYNSERAAFVGAPFDHADAPWAEGLVFNRGGYYGFMDAQGEELLAPRHTEIKRWGDDRLWSRRYLAERDARGLLSTELGLHRLDGSLLARWADALATPLQTWQGEQDTQAVAQLNGKTYHTAQGAYFPQQWVDRDGRTLMIALQCPGEDATAVLATGAGRLETGDGKVLLANGECEMPEEIRAAIARREGSGT